MNDKKSLWRKAVASIVAYTLAFAQIAPAAHAASTDISDIPLAVKNQVAPNIMMTLDDSGSMQWEFLPEDDMRSTSWVYPRPASPYGGGTYQNQVPNFNDTNVHNFYGRSSYNNKMYYNPDVTYRPWASPDGSLWTNADPTRAYYNPANTATGYMNLTAQQNQVADWFSDGGTKSLDSVVCDPGCGASHRFWPITYYTYKGSGSVTSRASYDLVQITSTTPASATYQYKIKNADGTTTTATRTRDQEIQNFANWFQYYRSRISAARAGIGRAFSTLGDTPRVGFATLNTPAQSIDGVSSPGAVLRGVRPFTGTDRTSFFNTLYGLTIDSNGTPSREAMDSVGQYFMRTDSRGPWGASPGTSSNITQLSCRRNYHVLMTDGYWNGDPANTSAARANVDNTTGPTQTSTSDPVTGLSTTYRYSPANPWRDSWSNTLADVAMYYWSRDLRSDLANNVFTSPGDNAFWQHLSVYGIALGVFGTIPAATIKSAYLSPYPTITWPDPSGSNPAKIDDLAHAALNSRGSFFSATDPDELASSLATALDNIEAIEAAGTAIGLATAEVVAGDSTLFATSYLPGSSWTGELGSYQINLATGKADMTNPNWKAQALLDKRAPTSRYIATYSGISGTGQGIQFQPTTAVTPTKLSSAQQALLNSTAVPPGPSDGALVVNYVRGDRSNEATAVYRTRTHLLGDIVNAEPVVVRPPSALYLDSGYSAFKTAKATRRQIVLQGANDGMLHAFDAGTAPVGTTPGTTGTGDELWAYVPSLVLSSLNNLSRRVGYTHKYYVDATPVAGDVDFSKTSGASGSADWRTIAVGGLGKGGRGFYALDLTNTTATSESDLAAKVLWEFPNSATSASVKANIGYSFGKPIITKTQAHGWVVVVTSGYNNGTNSGDSGGDGKGYLFVLNARTGDLIRALSTGAGSVSTPSGLTHIAGYAEVAALDNTIQYVYGGDLQGNVWRFDLTDPTTSAGWKAQKLATLVDSAGNFQPISTTPELAKTKVDGVTRRFVYVGTGLLLGDTDVPGSSTPNAWSSQTQTMYGLVDDLSYPTPANAVIQPLRSNLQQQVLTAPGGPGSTRNASTNAVDYRTKKGWYLDLTMPGERVNTNPALGAGALVFTSNVPNSDLCALGGSSNTIKLDFKTGGYLQDSLSPSSTFVSSSMASGPKLIRLPDTSIWDQQRCVTGSGCDNPTQIKPPIASGTTKRKSWREVLQ
jgi:type IV pilus assembly protein PilY1